VKFYLPHVCGTRPKARGISCPDERKSVVFLSAQLDPFVYKSAAGIGLYAAKQKAGDPLSRQRRLHPVNQSGPDGASPAVVNQYPASSKPSDQRTGLVFRIPAKDEICRRVEVKLSISFIPLSFLLFLRYLIIFRKALQEAKTALFCIFSDLSSDLSESRHGLQIRFRSKDVFSSSDRSDAMDSQLHSGYNAESCAGKASSSKAYGKERK
jgi:hypothetical protein